MMDRMSLHPSFRRVRLAAVAFILAACGLTIHVQSQARSSSPAQTPPAQTPPLTPDIQPNFAAPTASYDYVKRDVMIPMRDGVRLHTVIVIPKGAKHAPILLTRTPYNATGRA